MLELSKKNVQKHPFHLVDPSPWPLIAALGAFTMASGGVMYMHSYNGGGSVLTFGSVSYTHLTLPTI